MLSVEGLTVSFTTTAALPRRGAQKFDRRGVRIEALRGVDLTIADGEIVTLLGPSGCGKSTLLRTIAGLETPASGRVLWNNVDLAATAPHLRGFGLMFQDHMLFPHLDVLGNVGYGLRMARVARDEVARRCDEVLELVGLPGAGHRNVSELSGGEQQRVALARALAPRPRLLMLDEPLGSLDRALRERLVTDLRDVFVRLRLTVIAVTHDHDEAFALADSVAVMQNGHIEQIGTPAFVWNHPANEFAARFVGFDNTFSANVSSGVAHTALGTFPAPGLGDGPACVMLRTQDLHLDPQGPISGFATRAMFRRNRFLIGLQLTDGTHTEIAVSEAELPELGDVLAIAARPGAGIVFSTPA